MNTTTQIADLQATARAYRLAIIADEISGFHVTDRIGTELAFAQDLTEVDGFLDVYAEVTFRGACPNCEI